MCIRDRFIERADMLSRIIEDQILRKEARIPKYYENLQWMSILKSINGFESFKKINKEELRRDNVLNFIFKLKEFPRSVTFCINRLIAVSNYLPKSDDLEKKLVSLKKGISKINQKTGDAGQRPIESSGPEGQEATEEQLTVP